MSGDRIEGYLDQLLLELRGRATDVRRVLAETEEHLRDATADGIAAGLSPDDAEAQAIVRFGLAAGSGRLRISSRMNGDWAAGAGAMGTRTTTDVSARFTLRIVTVSVGLCAALSAARSALAPRLISPAGSVEATCRLPVRSWPDASCTAPKVPATARVAKTALKICDMLVCPSPHGDHGHNPGRPKAGPALFDHLTVYENICGPWERLRGPGVIPAAGYSPCPIDRRRRARPW